MQLRWFGQSAFLLDGSKKVFIDPFGDLSAALAERGFRFDYPQIAGVDVDLLLVTHEHGDHNAVEVVGGEPAVIRAAAGTHESAIGEVVGVSSEHDAVAGTQRGHNTIYCFTLDGTRFCHFGDFGQSALRPEQREAIGEVDVLFLPAGAGPTVAHDVGAEIVRELSPRTTIVMHHGNEAVDFLQPPDGLFDALGVEPHRLDSSEVAVEDLQEGVTVPGVPRA
ncbi:MAG TPA: MBL fold metallo-hydrolase [Gaiellaceae bacterium]|jgi:L-ascorbate metabolism protein UlaG (beta-lactamase superfamily)|nr:MBL fold metallo-hydrolase [Gaiellaceae bacterium]